MKRLTLRQRLFCEYYLATGNGTDSVINAGYNVKGNRKTASVISAHNLDKVSISQYLDISGDRFKIDNETMITVFNSIIHLDVNDHNQSKTILKAIDLWYKVTGKYAMGREMGKMQARASYGYQ